MENDMRNSHLILPAVGLVIAALTAAPPAFAKSRSHAATAAAKLDAARHIKSFNSIHDPSAVMFDGVEVGRDPDPNVRMRIWLDWNNPA
jgi:hypothetical protein